jgi:hypothetical protein
MVATPASDILDGDLRVDPVLVEQVDRVGSQSPKRPVDSGTDVVRSATDAGLVAVLVEGEPELGGDDDVAADRLQCLAHQLLVVEGAVDLGGVEQRDATVHRRTEERDHVRSRRSWPERLAHAHAAEAECGHVEGGCAEGAGVHVGAPSSGGCVVSRLRLR